MTETRCTCTPYEAGGDGPEIDCPVHGQATGSWVKVDCQTREEIVSRNGARYEGLGVASGRTDIDGQFGEPCIFTEWYDKATETSVMRDYRWPSPRSDRAAPDLKPCEHYEWVSAHSPSGDGSAL